MELNKLIERELKASGPVHLPTIQYMALEQWRPNGMSVSEVFANVLTELAVLTKELRIEWDFSGGEVVIGWLY